MQVNWSFILNILLLVGVMVAIARMLFVKSRQPHKNKQPSIGPLYSKVAADDIIAVRKVGDTKVDPGMNHTVSEEPKISTANTTSSHTRASSLSLVMFLVAKDKQTFQGYDLLQTILASGFRFGDGHLFHRYQHANGKGPVLCSLAAATPTGVFDLQNIGALSVPGLCLFMETSNLQGMDEERFTMMLDTGKQLSEGLNAHLLDENRELLTESSIQYYFDRIRTKCYA